jgi:FtsZ-binding cell division protein ZapB
MATPREDNESDSLASLEERITRAVEVVTTLRNEREQLLQRLSSIEAERDAAQRQAGDAQAAATRLSDELESLRSERKQVRTRIEKLLGQMDLLSAQ